MFHFIDLLRAYSLLEQKYVSRRYVIRKCADSSVHLRCNIVNCYEVKKGCSIQTTLIPKLTNIGTDI